MLAILYTLYINSSPVGLLIDIGIVTVQLVFCHAVKKPVLRFVPVYITAVMMILGVVAFFGVDSLSIFIFVAPLTAADLFFAWLVYALSDRVCRGKKTAIVMGAAVTVVTAALYGCILVYSGAIVFDCSAIVKGENTVYWNDAEYVSVSGRYREGKTVARADGGWRINEVSGDDSRTYIVLRMFLDQYLLVRSDYERGDDVTGVYCKGNYLKDKELIDAVLETISVFDDDTRVFDIERPNTAMDLYLCYDNIPVGCKYIGNIGTVDGVWYYFTYYTHNGIYTGGEKCYTVSDEAAEVFEKYLVP